MLFLENIYHSIDVSRLILSTAKPSTP